VRDCCWFAYISCDIIFAADDWNHDWATKNVLNLLKMHGASFPAIVVYTSKEWMPEIVEVCAFGIVVLY